MSIEAQQLVRIARGLCQVDAELNRTALGTSRSLSSSNSERPSSVRDLYRSTGYSFARAIWCAIICTYVRS